MSHGLMHIKVDSVMSNSKCCENIVTLSKWTLRCDHVINGGVGCRRVEAGVWQELLLQGDEKSWPRACWEPQPELLLSWSQPSGSRGNKCNPKRGEEKDGR